VIVCCLLALIGLSISEPAPKRRLDLLFIDAPCLVFVAVFLVGFWISAKCERPVSTSLTPTEAGIIATRRRIPWWLIALQTALVAWSAYGDFVCSSHSMSLAFMIVIFNLFYWRDWSRDLRLDCNSQTYQLREGLIPRSFAGPFQDIHGAFIYSVKGYGETTWSVFLLWRKRRQWTKVADYNDQAEAQRQCDALSQALSIPVVSVADAEKHSGSFSWY